jgi:hypothetical protein
MNEELSVAIQLAAHCASASIHIQHFGGPLADDAMNGREGVFARLPVGQHEMWDDEP